MSRRVDGPSTARWTLAAAVAALGALAFFVACQIPIEAGGLVFGPFLLLVALVCLYVAINLVESRRPAARPAEPNLRIAAGCFLVAAVAGVVKLLT